VRLLARERVLNDVLIAVVVVSAASAVVWAVFFYACCATPRPPEPGKFDGTGLAFTLAFFFGLIGLASAAALPAEAEHGWRWGSLVLINLALQPALCWLLLMCGYNLGMGLAGRVAYGFRVVPPQGVAPGEYRKRCGTRVGLSALVLLMGGGLGFLLLWPLL
jgi:hypothetical protein